MRTSPIIVLGALAASGAQAQDVNAIINSALAEAASYLSAAGVTAPAALASASAEAHAIASSIAQLYQTNPSAAESVINSDLSYLESLTSKYGHDITKTESAARASLTQVVESAMSHLGSGISIATTDAAMTAAPMPTGCPSGSMMPVDGSAMPAPSGGPAGPMINGSMPLPVNGSMPLPINGTVAPGSCSGGPAMITGASTLATSVTSGVGASGTQSLSPATYSATSGAIIRYGVPVAGLLGSLAVGCAMML